MKVKSESEVAQSCPTLSDPMDCSLPGSPIHGIFQARVLEWGAIAFSEWVKYAERNIGKSQSQEPRLYPEGCGSLLKDFKHWLFWFQTAKQKNNLGTSDLKDDLRGCYYTTVRHCDGLEGRKDRDDLKRY